jgi:LPXTG-site transpeptidase (sortase) family protein
MTYEKDTDLDINSIQEQNLKMLQSSMEEPLLTPHTEVWEGIEQESHTVSTLALVEREVIDKWTDDIEDVLQEVWLHTENTQVNVVPESEVVMQENITEEILEKTALNQEKQDALEVNGKNIFQKIVSSIWMLFRYILTASFIFVVLMAFTNYSAYITIAKSYLNPEAIEASEKNIQNSMKQSQIDINYEEPEDDNREEARAKVLKEWESKIYESKDIRTILGDIREEEISLDIEIIPFVNRLVIPKIWKNVPLIDIAQWNVEWLDELNDIFMDELEDGVVRYPGSAQPWEFWNAFIFGHSSNFPWVAWDYNDVFALLDRLEIGDEVVTYYGGQKYTYKIKQKEVINPNDVSVLKRETNKKEITLMTCWPIGTTYNRLLVIGELVKE